MTDDAINETVIHEIVQALCTGHLHDSVCQSKCIELGDNVQRCGVSDRYKDVKEGRINFQLKNYKYTLICSVCDHKEYINRQLKRASSCGKHGHRYYNSEYKLIITQNY